MTRAKPSDRHRALQAGFNALLSGAGAVGAIKLSIGSQLFHACSHSRTRRPMTPFDRYAGSSFLPPAFTGSGLIGALTRSPFCWTMLQSTEQSAISSSQSRLVDRPKQSMDSLANQEEHLGHIPGRKARNRVMPAAQPSAFQRRYCSHRCEALRSTDKKQSGGALRWRSCALTANRMI